MTCVYFCRGYASLGLCLQGQALKYDHTLYIIHEDDVVLVV